MEGYSQVEIVLRVADGDPSRIIPLVTEVIASKVDVLFPIGPAVMRAARSATQTIPIVGNDLESDPVDTGWVASLAHPGGNITGVFMAFPDFATKWLGLLKDAVPQLSRAAILWDPSTGLVQKKAIEDAAKASKVTLETMEVQTRPISTEPLIRRSEEVPTPSSCCRPRLSARMCGRRPSLRCSTICR